MTTVLDASALDGTTDGGSDNSVTFRIIISAAALAAASGNQAQVVFRSGNPSGSASPTISGAFIGQAASAGSLNFNGNQVRLTFAGGNTANVTAANQNVTSDVVTLGETFDNTKDYIVSFRFDVGASAPTTIVGTFSNVNAQFLLASTAGEEGNTTAAGGYTSQAGTDQFLRQIFITGGVSGGIASVNQNFKIDKFKTPSRSMGPKAGLFQVRAFPQAGQAPFRQTDWRLPVAAEPYPYRSFEWDNRQILTGKDALPFRQRDWPLPIAGEPDWRRDWVLNLLQTTLTPTVVIPFRQTDWQLPLGTEPDWRRSWASSYNLNLIGQDQLPFRQKDWPLPQSLPLIWTDQLPNFLPLTTVVIIPFRQTDWPLPIAAEPDPRRSWSSSYNINLIGKDALPFRQFYWPLPQAPEPDARRSATRSYNLNLIGQDLLPFRQMAWPIPLPASTWQAAPTVPNLVINLPPPPAGTTVQVITSMAGFFNPNASAIP